jgi:hypothetical protein
MSNTRFHGLKMHTPYSMRFQGCDTRPSWVERDSCKQIPVVLAFLDSCPITHSQLTAEGDIGASKTRAADRIVSGQTDRIKAIDID